MVFARIIGIGGFLPEKIVTNDELSKTLDTTNQWIVEHTGIKQRHIIDHNFNEGITTGFMASRAAQNALQNADFDNNKLDTIIVATTTNDRIFPSCAAYVQKKIGARNSFVFDVQAVCSGFLFALSNASSLIESGRAKNILVIGSETMSRIVDWNDRKTCVLFGDGAGAVLLQADENSGIMDFSLHSDGRHDSDLNAKKYITMNGSKVFRHAIKSMTQSVDSLLKKNHLHIDDCNFLIAHQANQRIINTIKQKLSPKTCRFVSTIAKHANTSAASIPLALNEITNQIKKDDLIILTAFGGGFTWGSMLIRY